MRGFFYLSILFGLAALSSWLLRTVQSTLLDENARNSDLPLLYMERFSATRMNAQGVRQYNLTSPYLVQLPDDKGSLVLAPHITTYQADGRTPDWFIDAERGRITSDNSIISLENKVLVNRAEASGKLPMVITGRDVIVRPQENIIESSQNVRLESSNGVLQAIGFKAYLNSEQVELLSNVRGNFKPSR